VEATSKYEFFTFEIPLEVSTTVGNQTEIPMINALAARAVGKTSRKIVYNGQWYTPLREAMDAFVDKTQETVNGDVKLKLYKGNIINAGVTSPDTLYSRDFASFDEDDVYDQKDSAGFINLFGLPIHVKALLDAERNKK